MGQPMKKFCAVILAGDRIGDGFARELGVKRKVLAPLAGKPMLLYVLDAIRASDCIGSIWVVANQIDDLANDPAVKAYLQDKQDISIKFEEGCSSPTRSVAKVMDKIGSNFPMLLTTGDHPLLTADVVSEFCQVVSASQEHNEMDFYAGLATRSKIFEAFPGVKRTFYELEGEGYSGSNIFAMMTPNARDVVLQWGGLDSNRKKAWRMVLGFGPMAILRYFCGQLSLESAINAIAKTLDAKVDTVVLSDGKASMDVDRMDHYHIAQGFLIAQEAAQH